MTTYKKIENDVSNIFNECKNIKIFINESDSSDFIFKDQNDNTLHEDYVIGLYILAIHKTRDFFHKIKNGLFIAEDFYFKNN